MGHLTTTFLGKEYTIPEDVLVYIDLLDFAENIKNQLFNAFVHKLKAEIQKGNVGLLGDNDLAPEIEQQVGRFISKLCDHGIFTRTVSDYLNGNKGYQYYSDVNKAALAKIKSLLMKRLDSLQEGYEDAVQRADSHVTGMGFSIWSGSFVNHAIYAAMEASTINKQEKEATAQYQREITALCSKLESDYNRETSQYINNEYIPNMEAALTVLTYELLDRYVADMIAYQKFDGKMLDFINIGRSNDLLKNLTLSGNKNAILENAFAACPYNIAVYMQAMKYDLLDYASFQTAKVFKQDHHVLSFFRENWGEASFPTKFEINYHCINVWAALTKQTSVDLLHNLTEPYARGVVKAYSRIADMLADEHLCRKVIEGYGEDRIVAGDAICRSKANEYTASIVPVGVWEQLTEKCGHTDLLELIKKRFPSTSTMDSRGELNAHITEQLYIAFESARKTLVDLIEKKKQQAEARAKEEARVREEQKRKRTERNKKIGKAILKIAVVTIAVVAVLLIALTIVNKVIIPAVKYNDAVALMKSGDYEEARNIFIALDGYKDSSELQQECDAYIDEENYNNAILLMEEGKYADAIAVFEALDGYKDCDSLSNKCKTALLENAYNEAIKLIETGDYENAYKTIISLGDYKDCLSILKNFSVVYQKEHIQNYAGNWEGTYLYTYDSFGRLMVKDYKDGTMVYEYTYDDNYLISMILTIDSGKTSSIDYYYDSEGLLIRTISISMQGEMTTTQYYYNDGVLIKSVATDDDGSYKTTVFSYDANGWLIQEYSQLVNKSHPEGYPYETIIEYSYDGYGQVLTEIWTFDDGDVSTTEYMYDAYGCLIKEICSDGNDIIEYKYDDNHFLISKSDISDGEVDEVTEYSNHLVFYTPNEDMQ